MEDLSEILSKILENVTIDFSDIDGFSVQKTALNACILNIILGKDSVDNLTKTKIVEEFLGSQSIRYTKKDALKVNYKTDSTINFSELNEKIKALSPSIDYIFMGNPSLNPSNEISIYIIVKS